jgi:hypothetical protein
MKPGRELDALVAEKVMGWMRQHDIWYGPKLKMAQAFDRPPNYSTDIAAAWEIVEKFSKLGWDVTVFSGGEMRDGDEIYAEFDPRYCDGKFALKSAYTAPHAICLAALNAVGAL